MDIISIIQFAGGIALFLYGMKVMGTALEKQAGGRFRKLMESITTSPMKGVLLGFIITAVVQSCSATTVMVVGFVNSGIMMLENAVNVIIGTNVGAAVTFWILSLTGLQGDSILIQLCKPANFSPILAVIGIIILMVSKNEKKRDMATALIGFTVLIFGMDLMAKTVAPLANDESFIGLFTMFQNPLLGVLVGTGVTAIIQSSGASVGILQAIAMGGGISYAAAIPIIMGQNIGTCVTALISSFGTNTNARRAALIHLYYNVIGVAVLLTAFMVVNHFAQFAFMSTPITPIGIAFVHTVFKIVNMIWFMPFRNILVKLARLTVKDDPGQEQFELLDDRFLSSPGLAIENCRMLTNHMAGLCQDSLLSAMGMINHYDEKTAQIIQESEDTVDQFEDKLGNYMVKLSAQKLSTDESHEISRMLRCIGDLERISDHAENIMETCREMEQKDIVFSGGAQEELEVMVKAVREVTELATTCFISNDPEMAKRVEPLEEVVDLLKKELKARHIARLQRGECTTMLGFVFSDLINDFERVADHCSNIALGIIQAQRLDQGSHQYIIDLMNSDDPEFRKYYKEYSSKYSVECIE